jgi:bacterial/archaeal transporter family-2 protein
MDLKSFAILLAFLGGAVLPLQVGINGMLRRFLEHPMQATAISFAVGALTAGIASIVLRAPLPSWDRLSSSASWMWFGGIFGAFYIFTTIFAAPKIGATSAATLAVAGQVLVALVADHYGWLSFPQSSISWAKIVGVVMVVGGAGIIAYAKA